VEGLVDGIVGMAGCFEDSEEYSWRRAKISVRP
jgi:hypothetical protein